MHQHINAMQECPSKGEALPDAGAQASNDQPSPEPLREQSYPKRLASLQARFALAGFELYPLSDETLLVARWNLSRALPSIEAAERFLRMVGGA